MKKFAAIVWIGTIALIGNAMYVSAEETADIVRQAANLTGNDYRRTIAGFQAPKYYETALREVIERAESTLDEKLVARILLARFTHSEVFKECEQKIHSFLMRQRTDRPFGTRAGVFSGYMNAFASDAPESRLLLVKGSVKWPGNPETEGHDKVEKYSEREVREGKARNAAARLAVLEYFLKFSQEDSEYQQRELVDLIYTWWRDSDPRKPEDRIQGTVLLYQVYNDETRPLSVRAAALTRLPVEKREGQREFMIDILRSPKTCNEGNDEFAVRQAVAYLKQHAPDSLKNIHTKTHWKQVLINEAAGHLSPEEPAPRKETQEIDIVVDVEI